MSGALLKLRLEADSGFESEGEHRITVEQWEKIQRVLHGTELPAPSSVTQSERARDTRCRLTDCVCHDRCRHEPCRATVVAWIAAGEFERMQDKDIEQSVLAYNGPLKKSDVPLYAVASASAPSNSDAKDAARYRFLRDGEPNATFITSKELRGRWVADADVDLDRYIDESMQMSAAEGATKQ